MIYVTLYAGFDVKVFMPDIKADSLIIMLDYSDLVSAPFRFTKKLVVGVFPTKCRGNPLQADRC